ncbi:MAG: hypothetical protein ACMX3H_17890 [Sodalis sp. (in: enterobacteria)]|uniref:hypothetical protein n=1 Tax=Sodalis sp. (in: enterobacteria) TaxID=1898979 RepID=UPI0039E644A2
MEHILTGLYNKPTNNSRRPPRGAYCYSAIFIGVWAYAARAPLNGHFLSLRPR